MVRLRSKVDDNQAEIVQAFRSAGASVKQVHIVKGFVDVVVGYCGVTELVEIKDGSKPPSKRNLTAGEQEFWDTWKGRRPVIVETVSQVPEVLSEMVK